MDIKSKDIALVDVGKVIPNPKNNNKHSKEQIKRLSKIIKHNGFRVPVIVSNRSGFLIAGHGRLEAAKVLKIEKIPVIYQDFQNEAEEYQFLTADNAIAAWAEIDLDAVREEIDALGEDFDVELFGLDGFEVDVEVLKPQSDEDNVPEVSPDPITKLGDVWLLGNHRVMCGDSTMIDNVEKLTNGKDAQLLFTDPPYGGAVMGKIGGKETGFNKSVNKIKRELDFISRFDPKELLQTISFLNVPSAYIFTNLSILKDYLTEKSKILIWHKKHGMPSVGNYNSDIEFIVFNKKSGAYFNNGDSDLRYSRLISMAKKDRGLHPTMKPIELIENCLRVSSKTGEIVIDLFLGSGSTLITCEKTNRKCYGMELDPKYCDVIVRRWQEYTGRQATLEATGEVFTELEADSE